MTTICQTLLHSLDCKVLLHAMLFKVSKSIESKARLCSLLKAIECWIREISVRLHSGIISLKLEDLNCAKVLNCFGANGLGYKAAHSRGKDQAQRTQGAEQADHGAFMDICFYQNRGLIDGQWEASIRL